MNSETSERQHHDIESTDGVISRSAGAVRNRTEGGGASLIHVDTVGKSTVMMFLVLALIAVLASVFAAYAWNSAARAAEMADQADRSAAISRLYAVQVYTELNRLGYPVKTPAEFDHELQPED